MICLAYHKDWKLAQSQGNEIGLPALLKLTNLYVTPQTTFNVLLSFMGAGRLILTLDGARTAVSICFPPCSFIFTVHI